MLKHLNTRSRKVESRSERIMNIDISTKNVCQFDSSNIITNTNI